mgnify:FL=1
MTDDDRGEDAHQGSWLFATTSAALPPGGLARRVLADEPVLIGRTAAGTLFALRDICPHRLVPLSAGRQVETGGVPTVECPYHGWRFGTDGVCRLIPSLTGEESIDVNRIGVARHAVAERAGAVFVTLDPEPGASIEPPRAPPAAIGKPILAEQTICEPWHRVATAVFGVSGSKPPAFAWVQNHKTAVLTAVVPETAKSCRISRLTWPTSANWSAFLRPWRARQNRRELSRIWADRAV